MIVLPRGRVTKFEQRALNLEGLSCIYVICVPEWELWWFMGGCLWRRGDGTRLCRARPSDMAEQRRTRDPTRLARRSSGARGFKLLGSRYFRDRALGCWSTQLLRCPSFISKLKDRARACRVVWCRAGELALAFNDDLAPEGCPANQRATQRIDAPRQRSSMA